MDNIEDRILRTSPIFESFGNATVEEQRTKQLVHSTVRAVEAVCRVPDASTNRNFAELMNTITKNEYTKTMLTASAK